MESNFEGSQYFLGRIRTLEETYKMKSWEFQLLYENSPSALPGYNGQAAVDYSEWAFLCENLPYIDSALCESPPWVIPDTDQQKPENLSGFCFTGGKGDQFSAPVSGTCRGYSL